MLIRGVTTLEANGISNVVSANHVGVPTAQAAFKVTLTPLQMLEGLAPTEVAAGGIGVTFIIT